MGEQGTDMRTWRLKDQDIFEIAPLRECLTALELARKVERTEQGIILLVGEPGTGKTVNTRIFCQESKDLPAHISIPAAGLIGTRHILSMIARALHICGDFRSPFTLARYLIEESLIQPRIIILDNAQAIATYKWLDVIRWLNDESSHTFVLAGTPSLEAVFAEHREFAGRVMLRYRLRPPTAEEISPLFEGFPEGVIAQVHEESEGRMREVMALRRWLLQLVTQKKIEIDDIAPKQVSMIARRFLMRVA